VRRDLLRVGGDGDEEGEHKKRGDCQDAGRQVFSDLRLRRRAGVSRILGLIMVIPIWRSCR
jgi:hypothetical protein